MRKLNTRPIQVEDRYQMQNATSAIRDIFDALTELITNSDDRYEILRSDGKIEVEVQRQRGGKCDILRVRDYADGMSASDMDKKLGWRGGRVSGLELGEHVRGTNSRGAKDIAVLGRTTFESIKGDMYHRCEIWRTDFTPFESEPATDEVRARLGISRGTGTVVTLEIEPQHKTPQHEGLVEGLARLVPLRDVVRNPRRTILVRDVNQDREDSVVGPRLEGRERVKESFQVPGFPDATAKLVIYRAPKPFQREKERFRLGGILVKSSHAVHEATLFDSRLENDPHAAWFFGKLTCSYIDELWNGYDNRMAERQPLDVKKNPCPVIDPLRRAGLDRGHPFTQQLRAEVLRRLRPLVEEERRQAESQRAKIESRATRKRLDKLEQAAAKFIDEHDEDDEPTRDPDASIAGGALKDKGFALNPPFAKIICGHSQKFWFNASQEAFPELEEGTALHVECMSDEIVSSIRVTGLEPHPSADNVLRATWTIKGVKPTPAAEVRVRVGPIHADSQLEVLEKEADQYAHVKSLQFSKKTYRVRAEAGRRRIVLLAPLELVAEPTVISLTTSGDGIQVSGDKTLIPIPDLGIARCVLAARARTPECEMVLSARVADQAAEATVISIQPKGAGIKIKLDDIDLQNQRYRWRQNVLEIATRHPSLVRYLGSKTDGFPGQEEKHFRLLIAEIVADAVCARIIGSKDEKQEYEDEQRDWEFFYSEYTRLLTRFLPIAHKLQIAD